MQEYTAFISYRHKEPDITVAKAIHSKLENFAIPSNIKKTTGMKKVGRCFRDQEELPTSSDLAQDIIDALTNSKWLVVVCTPDTPNSKWCIAEIETFIRLHGRSRVLAVLAAGEPEQSFPEILRFDTLPDGARVEREPLAADLRADGLTGIKRKLKIEKYRILAPILGVAFDDLRRRARERTLRIAVASSVSVAVFFAVFGGYALNQAAVISRQNSEIAQKNSELTEQIYETNRQKEQAQANEEWALRERNDALVGQSNFLASLSDNALASGDRATATLLALEALPKNLADPERPLVEAAIAALRNTGISRHQGDYTLSGGVQTAYGDNWSYLEKDDILAVNHGDDWDYYNMRTGAYLGKGPEVTAYNPTRGLIARASRNPSVIPMPEGTIRTIDIYSLSDLTRPMISIPGSDYYHKIMFCPDGLHFIRYSTDSPPHFDNYVELVETDTGSVVYRLSDADFSVGAIPSEEGSPVVGIANRVAVSPDGRYLFVYVRAANGTVPYLQLFDLPTGKKIRNLEGEISFAATNEENGLFSPDGRFFCGTDNKGIVFVYSTQTGRLAAKIDEFDGSRFVWQSNELEIVSQSKKVFSQDSSFFAFLIDDVLRVYRTDTWEKILEVGYEQDPVNFIGFTGTNTFVCQRGNNGDEISFYSLLPEAKQTQAVTIPDLFNGDAGKNQAGMQIYKDGFVAYSKNGVYQRWQRTESADLTYFSSSTLPDDRCKAYSLDGMRFAVSNDGIVYIYDAQTHDVLAQSDPKDYHLPVFLPDGSMLPCLDTQLIWSPDGSKILTADNRAGIYIHDSHSGKRIAYASASGDGRAWRKVLAISPDGSFFAANDYGDNGGMFDFETLERLYKFPDSTNTGARSNFSFSADGKEFYVITRDGLFVLDARTGEQKRSLPYQEEGGLGASPDGRYLAFGGSQDGSPPAMYVIDLATGMELWHREMLLDIVYEPIVWSPDSAYFAATHSREGITAIFEVASGRVVWEGYADSPSFSPDSRLVLLSVESVNMGAVSSSGGGAGHSGVILDLVAGEVFARLPKPGVFSPDGDEVLMQDSVWRIKPLSQLVSEAISRLGGRTLTLDERKRFFIE